MHSTCSVSRSKQVRNSHFGQKHKEVRHFGVFFCFQCPLSLHMAAGTCGDRQLMTSACMEIPLRPAFPVMTCMQWYLVSRISQIHGVPRLAGKKGKITNHHESFCYHVCLHGPFHSQAGFCCWLCALSLELAGSNIKFPRHLESHSSGSSTPVF